MAKVLFCTNIIPPYRTTFYEKLSEVKKIDLTVAHYRKNYEDGRPSEKGDLSFNHVEIYEKTIKIGPYQIIWQKGIIKEFLKGNYTHIVLSGTVGNFTVWILLIMARFMRVRSIMWACGYEPKKDGSLALKIKKKFYKFFFSAPDTILTYSSKAKKYINSMGIKKEKLFICFNGIELQHILSLEDQIRGKGNNIRNKIADSNATVFLYVGAMLKEKRVDLLIKAFLSVNKKYNNVYLWLIGDGPDISNFKELADKNSSIQFFGRIVNDVDKYFSVADFFVLPGIGGLALNQALFWRTPCIVSEADGTEDDLVYNNKTGFLFNKDSVVSLEKSMDKAINITKNKKKEMSDKGRELVLKRSNVDKMVQIFTHHMLKD